MLEQFEQIGYSRMPVYRDSLDNVIGIALHKDLGRLVRTGSQASIDEVVRPAVFLPTSMRLNDALRSLRRSSAHMALVVDDTAASRACHARRFDRRDSRRYTRRA